MSFMDVMSHFCAEELFTCAISPDVGSVGMSVAFNPAFLSCNYTFEFIHLTTPQRRCLKHPPPNDDSDWICPMHETQHNATMEEGLHLAQAATRDRITSRTSKQPAMQTSLLQPERVRAEDIFLAAKVCFASFSRHVDLLEPLVEPRLAAAMRSVAQQEHSHVCDEDDLDVPQPEDICGTMRFYQIQGLNWLLRQYRMSIGSILADEMGLGKTIQTISFIAHLLRTQERPSPNLIIVPLSVLSNWGIEFKKFCPRLRVKRIHIYSGRDALKIYDEISKTPSCAFDVVLTTYEVIKSRFWICKLARMNWQTVVLDEGHRVKNESTLVAHHCSLLRARFRLILTGTPSTPKIYTVYSYSSDFVNRHSRAKQRARKLGNA